jgi:hypothetical protein
MSLTALFINRPRTHPVPPPPSLANEQARLAQEQRELERERSERQEQREQQRAERRRLEADRRTDAIGADLGRAMDINRPAYMASLILKAAAKGRGEAAEPRLAGLAAQIVFQGKIRRGEVVADAAMLPPHPVARAVVLAAKRARGEATADEESWLSSFLERVAR